VNFEKHIASGNTADIFLHEGKIIKLFKDFLPDTEAEYEANKQKFAHSQGLLVPYVYEVTKINGKQAIIMEYVKGKTLGNIMLDDMTKAEHYISHSVDIQLKIHEISANQFNFMADKLNRNIFSASVLSKKQKEALSGKLQSMKYDKNLCHGDYHVLNLIINETGTTIIDWVDSSAGDRKADVYRTYLLYSQNSIELADMYINIYCEKSGISQNDIFEWEAIIAGARLSENVAAENEKRLLEIVSRYYPE
jgi:aminoglycoside phosphotransferase (APT) family kinase protein